MEERKNKDTWHLSSKHVRKRHKLVKKVKVKEADLYSALLKYLLKYLTLKALRYGSHSVTCNQHRSCLYLVSIHQMARIPDWGCGHLIAAYYSFIYPERMKGWVGLGGWLRNGQFTCPKAVTHPSTNRARCRATALIETNALPLVATPNRQPTNQV